MTQHIIYSAGHWTKLIRLNTLTAANLIPHYKNVNEFKQLLNKIKDCLISPESTYAFKVSEFSLKDQEFT